MPPNPKRKARLARIPREEAKKHIEESQETWAVSYADFLMVLLSFFILFFSTDSGKKESIVQQIVTSVGSKGAGNGNGKARDPASAEKFASIHELETRLKSVAEVELSDSQESLVIHLPDNIFDKGKLTPRSDQAQVVHDLFDRIGKFRELIKITVVGHSDSTPVNHSRSNAVQTNFDLSSLRATRFLQLMVKEGFSPEQLSAKGTAEFNRNSRTVSLLLEAKGTGGL